MVPTRRWRLCERNSSGNIEYFIAILQAEARSEFNTTQYAMSMKALTGFEPQNPTAGGTFVAHHMVFNKHFMKELLDHMIETTKSGKKITLFPLLVTK